MSARRAQNGALPEPPTGPGPSRENLMSARTAQRALIDATLALVAALAGIAMFLPPLLQATTGSLLRSVAAGLLIALAMLLHWVFLGIAARRLHRSVAGWVGLSVLLFPVGGAAALILLAWLLVDEQGQADPPAPAGAH